MAEPLLPPVMPDMDVSGVETPAFVIDLGALEDNLRILDDVQTRAGCTVILALKGFATWSTFPLVRRYLAGVTASSVAEARLGADKFGGQVHAYAPAYSKADLDELLPLCNHLVFNSATQWQRWRDLVREQRRDIACGLRINPEHSEVETALYDPCAPNSRLGTTVDNLREAEADGGLEGITGLHFHTLCELGADALERTLAAVEERFAPWLERMSWVNMGGGHHITRADYDRDRLVDLVRAFRDRWSVDVILEPGEAIALNTGVLVASVLDIVPAPVPVAILDTSATAHMPDVLEMPYRPTIVGGAEPGQKAHTYRLGGLTCLAGDVVGDWSFDEPLSVGDKLTFLDMAHYTMVKTTTFNGVRHPDIALHDPATRTIDVVRRFGYADYRDRLG